MRHATLFFLSALALAACDRLPSANQRQPAEAQPAASGHGHAAESITHYTQRAELFVEFPALIVGQESPFAAHLTWLSDDGFRPVTEGRVTVTLAGGAEEERFEAPAPTSPGIFRPVVKPRHAGKRQLALQLDAAHGTSLHELGEVEVFPDAASAARNAPHEEETSGQIAFLKEQQWKIEFATLPVPERLVRESVPVTATIRPRASGEARIAAPGAGLLRPGPAGFPQVGMRVSAGQVLGFLLPRLGGETDAATLELAVERAQVEVEQARRELERLESLLQAEAIPEKRVFDARNRERIAGAELAAARRRAATYQGGAGGIALKSPIAGTVISVNGSPGAAVAEGQTVFHIADLGKLWLEAHVPESDLGRVKTPTGAFFRLEGEADPVVLEAGQNARLVAFGGLVDKDTRTAPAIFEFANPQGRLKAGMNLRAALYTGAAASGLAVPASALVDDGGQPVVFVQIEGETFERRLVTLGARDGDWIAVRSGLTGGERVVTLGAYQVRLAATAPAALGHGHAH